MKTKLFLLIINAFLCQQMALSNNGEMSGDNVSSKSTYYSNSGINNNDIVKQVKPNNKPSETETQSWILQKLNNYCLSNQMISSVSTGFSASNVKFSFEGHNLI